MVCPKKLLRDGVQRRLEDAVNRYPRFYDEVLDEVHHRLVTHDEASKVDLAALIGWKHVRNAPWMRELLTMSDSEVRDITRRAIAGAMSDSERVAAIRPLPGFGSGGAFTSVFFAAWSPERFGVYDRLVNQRRRLVVEEDCGCMWSDLPTYWQHLRRIAAEMNSGSGAWTPRMVEMAILNLDLSDA